MEFLDPKEQVIDIELTPYGKYLMSVGKFKPEMYAFYDDDILYDAQFAALPYQELQNDIEPRILEDTPRLTAQGMYRGSDLSVFSTAPNLVEDLMPGVLADKKNAITIQNTPTALNILQSPLGTSAFNSNKMPAWNIGFFKTKLDKVSYTLTGSVDSAGTEEFSRAFIPQLTCSINYQVNRFLQPGLENGVDSEGSPVEDEFEGIWGSSAEDPYNEWGIDNELVFSSDATKLEFIKDYVFLQVEEANAEFLKDNFTLEVFEEITVDGDAPANKYTYLKPLYFQTDSSESPDTSNVEYYFDIFTDYDIDQQLYCSLIKQQDKVKNIYQDKLFTCPEDDEGGISADVYNTGDNVEPGDVC